MYVYAYFRIINRPDKWSFNKIYYIRSIILYFNSIVNVFLKSILRIFFFFKFEIRKITNNKSLPPDYCHYRIEFHFFFLLIPKILDAVDLKISLFLYDTYITSLIINKYLLTLFKFNELLKTVYKFLVNFI